MITIKNDHITAEIQELGAEMKRLYSNNTEYLWPGDENIWNYSSPILFPICGGLKDGIYYYNGQKYTLPGHGFARNSMFGVESLKDDEVVFLLRSNEDSKQLYPFDFELRLAYTLIGNSLRIRYDVTNCSDKTMYFSIGSHEGYDCPEGIQDYDLIFTGPQTLFSRVRDASGLTNECYSVLDHTDKLSLGYDLFNRGTLIFENIETKEVTLQKRNSSKALRITFDDFDHFMIWTLKDAPYVCLEPWCGLPDTFDTTQNLKEKKGIKTLDAGKQRIFEHTIEILG